MSFVAGRVFKTPQEAKEWVEATVKPEDRFNWIVFEVEGWVEEGVLEKEEPQTVEGSVIPSKV